MSSEETESTEPTQEVVFQYKKSNFFRVIRVDGAIGGLLPRANALHISFYSQRPALPTKVVHELVDGQLGEARTVEGGSGFIRELEVDAVLDIPTAFALQEWLKQQIESVMTMQEGPETREDEEVQQ